MGPRPGVPRRGEIYSINPNPVAGRETRDRHYWLVLSPEAVNRHGVAIAVVISTVAAGARAAGLTVPISGDGVTGVAICTQVRSFDLRARLADGTASLAGTADPGSVEEAAARVAALLDPAPEG
ncbi:type II toxin-antitoxin system PemK/MazF family toxin [Methylobacterium sp. B4]|uniref:type II toxin-antitoxin system PemK/MazF family toxin n=1 Tax=Methylobacterium sp. B4 TaxID=1938755 RepID=UPI000D751360|nr:type II toxin-antitoxin system PemK/MazF family toxin [Methylobacterium sp. B4]PXW65443.1 mRNA interferase ChpB [Methylobacterium sp. B4]